MYLDGATDNHDDEDSVIGKDDGAGVAAFLVGYVPPLSFVERFLVDVGK